MRATCAGLAFAAALWPMGLLAEPRGGILGDHPISVALGADCQASVNDEAPVDFSALTDMVRAEHWDRAERIFVRGTSDTPYQCVVDVMAMLSSAGVSRIGIVGAYAPVREESE